MLDSRRRFRGNHVGQRKNLLGGGVVDDILSLQPKANLGVDVICREFAEKWEPRFGLNWSPLVRLGFLFPVAVAVWPESL